MHLRLISLAAALILTCFLRPAQADMPLFSSDKGIALSGYDTVAFFEEGRAVPGEAHHAVMWKGVIWRFASPRNREHFESNPRAYAPKFGGYCAYGMSQGLLLDGNPRLWAIVDDRLYLLNNRSVQELWQQKPGEFIVSARANWPKMLGK